MPLVEKAAPLSKDLSSGTPVRHTPCNRDLKEASSLVAIKVSIVVNFGTRMT